MKFNYNLFDEQDKNDPNSSYGFQPKTVQYYFLLNFIVVFPFT